MGNVLYSNKNIVNLLFCVTFCYYIGMKKLKNILILLVIVLSVSTRAWASVAWVNDLKSLFLSNGAIIYAINLRTFNADDKNQNGIIEEELGEESGTFLNAIDRLDELQSIGINTIHLLPITPVGKVKALGTAGSLYAASSFNELNPQLKSKNNKLSIRDEARKFIEECHRRRIRVIVDMPSCGSYDLYLKRPELFVTDKSQNPVVPMDWTDVRLLNAGTNTQINPDVYKLYKDFVNMVVDLDIDGIRADVATIKPYEFWKKLISETKGRNPQFLFLAEASPAGRESPSEYAVFTPYNKLLDAGFDGYYGDYVSMKDWKTAQNLYSHVKSDLDISKKYSKTKSVIGNFTTHDEISPMLINGTQYSKMIIWLNATLPLNSYFVDGFPTGDDYLYSWANKKAAKTYTDDDYYFVHRGQIDIFNFSRKPGSYRYDVANDFIMANKFKIWAKDLLSKGTFTTFRTNSTSIFAYSRAFDRNFIVVVGNLDFEKTQSAKVYIPAMSETLSSMPVKIMNIPQTSKGKLETTLNPGEIQVLYFTTVPEK